MQRYTISLYCLFESYIISVSRLEPEGIIQFDDNHTTQIRIKRDLDQGEMNGHELEVLKDPDEGKMNMHELGRGTLLTSGVGAGDGGRGRDCWGRSRCHPLLFW